ncbi:MAG: ubiquinone biosynthesis accessory factor UbiJ [Casimicrobiaceae bacterium]
MRAAATLANRALEREDWARERLAAHAGRTVRIVAGPTQVTLTVNADGSFAEAQGTPDLTLTISTLRLPALLAGPERWKDLVVIDGDAALAATIAELAQTLPWFVERGFARAFGPIVGVELADAGRRLLALPGHVAERAAASFASYARDEADLAIGAGTVRDFAAQIAALAERVDALGERVDRLADRAPATPRSKSRNTR